MGADDVEIRRDGPGQYSASLRGHVVGQAFVAFGDGVWEVYRTVVEPAHEGQGIASQLIRRVLTDASQAGVAVVPSCWFVSGWIDRHPEFAHLRHGSRPSGYETADPVCRIVPTTVRARR